MARVKVIDRWPGYQRLAFVFAGGALVAAILIALRDNCIHRVNVPGFGNTSLTIYVAEASSLVVFTSILLWLSLSEQRVHRAALEGVVFGLGIAAVLSASPHWRKGESFGRLMATALGIVAVWLVVRLAALGVIRVFVRKLVLQDGSLCRGCGYNLTGNVSGVCPECGTATGGQMRALSPGEPGV